MAEIAIPLAALGVMYIVSNQKNKKDNLKEVFSNMHKRQNLPNTNKPVKNFPVLDRKELENNVQDYAGKKIQQTIIIIQVTMKLFSFPIKKQDKHFNHYLEKK